jgi:hypothetical protein
LLWIRDDLHASVISFAFPDRLHYVFFAASE